MNKITLPKLSMALLTCALGFFNGAASATTVSPVSYTFDQPTSCGSWCYHDAGNTKLTDGVLGTAGWAANSGAEWVGWVYQSIVNIDFDFGTQRRIDSLSVGSTQDNLGDVVLPSLQVFGSKDGFTWSLVQSLLVPASSANDVPAVSTDPHVFLNFSGLDIDARYVRVAALGNGPWTFVDEVRFAQQDNGSVPEPLTLGLLGAGLVALGVARRK